MATEDITIKNFEKIMGDLTQVSSEGSTGGRNARQGMHWLVKDIADDPATFKGKQLELNHAVDNARGKASSYIDVYCEHCTPPFLKIEYKSGPGSITSRTIKEQFIERTTVGVLDFEGRALLWHHQFARGVGAIGSIQAHGQRLYVHTQDNTLHVFEQERG